MLELESKIEALDKKIDSKSEQIVVSFRNELIALREGNDEARAKTAGELKDSISDLRTLITGKDIPQSTETVEEENK